jgi:hypothetical protein
MNKKIVLILCVQFCLGIVFGQQYESYIDDPLYKKIELNQVSEVLNVVEGKLKEYPKDYRYNYLAGVCIYKLNGDMDRAVRYLEYASKGEDIPYNVYLYLGKSYRKAYNFSKSVEYLERYKKLATVNQNNNVSVNQEIATSRNGELLVKYVSDIPVLNRSEVSRDDFFLFYSSVPKGFIISVLPDALLTDIDKEKGHKPILCIPEVPEPGTIIVYPSYGKSAVGNKDLYMVKMLENRLWSRPVALPPIINTQYTEDYSFFCSDGITLYFASEGLFSMGDLDIFVSKYNRDTDTWSEPENLDFPVNTPFNDFMFIPNESFTKANFVSDRISSDNKYTIHSIQLINSLIQRSPSGVEEIRELANMDIHKGSNKIPQIRIDEKLVFEAKKQTKVSSKSSYEDEYNKALNKALKYQLSADSVRRVIDDMRMQIDDNTNNNERKKVSAGIRELEKLAYSYQKSADKSYVLVRGIEKKMLGAERVIRKESESTYFIPECYLAKIDDNTTLFKKIVNKYESTTVSLEEVMRGNLSRYAINELDSEISSLNMMLRAVVVDNKIGDRKADDAVKAASMLLLTGKGILNNLPKSGNYGKQEIINAFKGIRVKFEALSVFEGLICENTKKTLSFRGVDIVDKIIEGVQERKDTESKFVKRSLVTKTVDFELTKADEPEFVLLDTVYYSEDNPIPLNPELPSGVIYRVQLGVFSKMLPYKVFKGMRPITYEMTSKGYKKYFAGLFKTYQKARENLSTIRRQGFSKAFIVPYFNGQRVKLQRAKLLEKGEDNGLKRVRYNVQITMSEKPIPESMSADIKKIIENKTLFKYKNAKGLYIYTVGDYDSKMGAQKFLNLIKKKGFPEARIVEIK